jgi:acyl-CoA hydrolase
MLAELNPVRDLRLSGQVIYVGTSSMEVAVRMEALNPNGSEETIMLGTPSVLSSLLSKVLTFVPLIYRPFLYGLSR